MLDDAHDEGAETLTAAPLQRRPGRCSAMAEATGTIGNTDAMPRAWLARFGRTVAGQVIDAVKARMEATPRPGSEVRLAGQVMGGEVSPEALGGPEPERGLPGGRLVRATGPAPGRARTTRCVAGPGTARGPVPGRVARADGPGPADRLLVHGDERQRRGGFRHGVGLGRGDPLRRARRRPHAGRRGRQRDGGCGLHARARHRRADAHALARRGQLQRRRQRRGRERARGSLPLGALPAERAALGVGCRGLRRGDSDAQARRGRPRRDRHRPHDGRGGRTRGAGRGAGGRRRRAGGDVRRADAAPLVRRRARRRRRPARGV